MMKFATPFIRGQFGIARLALQWYWPACEVLRDVKCRTQVERVPLTSGCTQTKTLPSLEMGESSSPSHMMAGSMTRFSITETVQVSARDEPATVTGGEATDTSGGGRSSREEGERETC